MNFDPMRFVETLKYMGIGILGVFIIVGIIIFATYAIAKYTGKAKKNSDNKQNQQ